MSDTDSTYDVEIGVFMDESNNKKLQDTFDENLGEPIKVTISEDGEEIAVGRLVSLPEDPAEVDLPVGLK